MTANTPPMGWNSWDCYGAAVTEDIVRKNAEYMAKYLKEYGWEYIVVDIQWSGANAAGHEYEPFADLTMDEYGRLIPAPNRFPSAEGGKGFRPLADYIHSLGLKFGIHIMRGMPRTAAHRKLPIEGSNYFCHMAANPNSICMWNPDMYGLHCERPEAAAYYDSIFRLYASWGVDFVKCDDIAREYPHCRREIEVISESCRHCGRDIVLSLSPGPAPLEQAEHLKQYANMWRITDDFWDKWELLYDMFQRAEKWCTHTGADHFPDADMLPIGPLRQDYGKENWTKFTKDEQVTMLTLWSIFRSPFMIGGEMTGFDAFTMSLLTNEDILKMHRNARHSHQVFRRTIGNTEYVVWMAVSAKGGNYVAVFNAGEEDGRLELNLAECEIDREIKVKELWSGEEGYAEGILPVNLKKHSAKVFYFA